MKPRLLPVPATDEDTYCWYHVMLRNGGALLGMRSLTRVCDRRDADRMLRIMNLGCRFCGSNSMYGEVHEVDCIYVTDASVRRVWLRKGARIIE